jgi:lysyl-tRNA synthetase class 1
MLWPDKEVDKIEAAYKTQIGSGVPILIRDEKTASGRVHIGSMRGACIHGITHEVLIERGIPTKFLWEINDFDPMDGLPVYLDQEKFTPYLGKPLYMVPSPDGKAKNFAEFYGEEFRGVVEGAGFAPEFYRASELYLSGKMNEVIKIALEKAALIRTIYKEVSGAVREDDWLPLNVICEGCGKVSTTKATSFDGEKVTYHCRNLEWTNGCGYEGVVSPYNGKSKLPWKVEWPAKWKVVGVTVEGAGKDHSTRGGSRDVAKRISKEVFDYEPPFDMPYEFFLVGGKKMSSSKGAGSSAKEIFDLLPPHIFRLALLGKDINQAINFDPTGDTVPVLYDTYDRLAEVYFSSEKNDQSRLFELIHAPSERKSLKNRFMPRFSLVAFLAQMPHMQIEEEVAKLKGGDLTAEDKEEIALRVKYAKFWLSQYAPEDFKFELQEGAVPESAKHFNDLQKEALKKLTTYLEGVGTLDGQLLHTELHEIRKSLNIEPKDFFSAIYYSLLGKESGPKAGWFLSVLNKDFLIKRFKEVV